MVTFNDAIFFFFFLVSVPQRKLSAGLLSPAFSAVLYTIIVILHRTVRISTIIILHTGIILHNITTYLVCV